VARETPGMTSHGDERARILEAYRRRAAREKTRDKLFVYEDMVHVYRAHERSIAMLRLLDACGLRTLADLAILDVGCGDGNMLRQWLQWGANPEHLAGIDLRTDALERARTLNPNLDVRLGSAGALPWEDESFDLVSQLTVFTSILDVTMKRRVAAEMSRVLRSGGAVLWYDFAYNNPRNPDVRGIGAREIAELFPGFSNRIQRVTLAPPLARRIPVPLLPVCYPLASALPFLRTHYLGLLRKR